MLTAEEWPGMLTTLLVLLRTNQGIEIFQPYLMPDTHRPKKNNIKLCDQIPSSHKFNISMEEHEKLFLKDKVSMNIELQEENILNERKIQEDLTLPGLIELIEKILSFHAYSTGGHPYVWDDNFSNSYYKLKPNYNSDDIKQKEIYIRMQIREMMYMIQKRIPRDIGNGWKIQKFHKLLHIPTAMTQYGAPANYNAGPGECRLKTWAKKPARKALQWDTKIILRSVAKQVHLMSSMTKMKHQIEPMNQQTTITLPDLEPPTDDIVFWKTSVIPSYFVQFDVSSKKTIFTCNNKKHTTLHLHPVVTNFIDELCLEKYNLLLSKLEEKQIDSNEYTKNLKFLPMFDGYLSITIKDTNFRCNPNFGDFGGLCHG